MIYYEVDESYFLLIDTRISKSQTVAVKLKNFAEIRLHV